MARLYSKKKGKHGSKKPLKKAKPGWVSHEAKVVEQLIVKYSKAGKFPSQIGMVLRDSYGIPDVRTITKKSITQILKENKLLAEIPEDLKSLIRREVIILKHLEANKHDEPSRRGLTLTESKINRLVKYYKESGRLPVDWYFNRSKAKMLGE